MDDDNNELRQQVIALQNEVDAINRDRTQLRAEIAAYLTRKQALVDALDLKVAYLQEQVQSLVIQLEKKKGKADTGPLLDAIRKTSRLLARHFSDNELRDLCLDLSVSYEAIDGSTPDSKARELAAYMARRGELGQLIKRCVELRPRVYGWPVQQIDEY